MHKTDWDRPLYHSAQEKHCHNIITICYGSGAWCPIHVSIGLHTAYIEPLPVRKMAATGAAAAVDLAANVGEVQMGDATAGTAQPVRRPATPPPEQDHQQGVWGPQQWAPQMQFQQPPGFAPPDPMMTFMHMMNNQMQAFMQNMQQMTQQNMFARQQQQVAPVHSNGSFQNRLDERCFRRLD